MKILARALGLGVLMFVLVFLPIRSAYAQVSTSFFTQAEREEQTLAVQERVVGFLQEYVKYLQMQLILKLEERVRELQIRVALTQP